MNWWCYPEDEGTTGSTDREKWDKNAAANLATLMYEGNAADYVVTGFDVSVDAGEATVSPGLARVSDVSANDHTEDEVRDWGVTYAVGLSNPVTVPVSDGDTLHIAFDTTQGDGGSIETNGAAVGIEIASIESGVAVPTNRNPSAAFQDASVETAPSSPTDVARKQEVDENATTIGGKADDPHGDAAHSEDYAKTGESQPPEGHDNTAHTEQYAVDGNTQPPETHGDTEHDATVPSQTEVDGKADDPHGSEAHSEDYAVDGDAQPPETHGDTEHDTTVPSTSDVDAVSTDLSGHEAADGDVHGVVSPDTVAGKSDVDDHEASTGDVHGVAAGDSVASQSDVDGKASDPHGNEAHDSTFATDGETQPPETHGDADHDTTVPDFDSDVSDFSGAAGTADQILGTDGTVASWTDPAAGGVATTETVKSGFNQIYTRLGLHDFELGLQMIGYKNGLYDIYADQSKIDVTDNIDLTTLGSPVSDLGYISIDKPGGFETFGSGQYDVSGERTKAQEFTDNHYIEWTGNNSPEVYTKGDHTSVTSLGGGDAGKLYYDGDYLYVGPRTSSVRVYDPDTWSRIETISIPNGPRAEDISASGDYLMVGAFDEYSYVFNKGTWDLETSFYVQYSNMFNVAISDEYAAYATTNANVEVVETGTWDSVTTLGYTDDTTDLRFSPDGSMLSVTGDNYTGIYNTDTWDEDQVVGSGGDLARWGPFSTQLLMDDLDQAEMYDVTTDNLTTTFNDPTNSVNALAWGPSGEYLSFGDLDGTAKVVENTMEVNPGFVEHRAENLDFPPSTVVIGQELRSLPNGTDVEYTISDENGNSLTLGQSDIDKEVDASVLTGTVLETRVDLIPDPSGLKTPELDSWATYFDEA